MDTITSLEHRRRYARITASTLAAMTIATVLALAIASNAHAGSYVINNCPSAPSPNGSAGPWQVYGAVTASKTACSAGAGDFIGPLGRAMAPNSIAGVAIYAPAGITIAAVSVYCYLPQSIEHAHTYAAVWSNSTELFNAFGGVDHTYTADNYTLAPG